MTGDSELDLLEAAVAAQEDLRGRVPDSVIAATLEALRRHIDEAKRKQQPKRRRLATVLFADVSGSTELAETIDAEEMSLRFDVLWQRLDRIIGAHGGVIDKHIGDAVMAVWGADGSSENDPERAVLAALQMLEAFDDLQTSGTLPGSAMRVGINTGPVVVGTIAGTNESTSMGDTVNVAARLEAAAPPNSVLIGHDTYRHIRGVFSVAIRNPLTVKGKREPLRTYLVRGVQPRAMRVHVRTIADVETPMVARERELARLRDAFDAVDSGATPLFATIVGEPGMGKSRLLFEFEDWLRARDGSARRFRGRADNEHRNTPYWLLRDLILDRFQIAEDEAPQIALAKIRVGIAEIADRDLTAEIELISHVVGVAPSTDGSRPDVDPDRVADAVARLFAASSHQMPVVVHLEDLHWADPASARLVAHLDGALVDGRVLVVAVSRTLALDDGIHLGAGDVHLELGPLPDDDIEVLVRELLDRADPIPDRVVRRCVDAAEGNPFFVEELIRMFLDESVIVAEDDGWHLDEARLADVGVPSTLRGVMQARLDGLPLHDFELLQRAAIVGESFWDSSIPRGSGPRMPVSELRSTLQALTDRGLIRPVPDSDFTGEAEHRFAHAMLRDVVYESVLLGRRAQHHAEVADWMAARADSAPATIAAHYAAADRLDEAANWYALATARAVERSAASEGIQAATAALGTERLQDEAIVKVLGGLIECLSIATRYEEALERTRELEQLGLRLDDAAVVSFARSQRSHQLLRLGRSRDALDEARSAFAAVGGLPADDATVIDSLIEVGWVLVRLGRSEEAMEYVEDIFGRIGPETPRNLRGLATNLAGAAGSAAGRYAEAEEHLRAGVEIARMAGDHRTEAAHVINLSEVARQRGELDRSIELSQRALDLVRRLRDRDQEALVLSNLGGALVEAGDPDAALPNLGAAMDAFERTGASEHVSETHRFRAEAFLRLGDLDGAAAAGRAALELARTSENPDHLGHAWRVMGLLADRSDGPVSSGGRGSSDDDGEPDPETCLRRAVEHFSGAGMVRDQALTLGDLAVVVGRRSPEERDRLMAEAKSMLDGLDLPLLRARLDHRSG